MDAGHSNISAFTKTVRRLKGDTLYVHTACSADSHCKSIFLEVERKYTMHMHIRLVVSLLCDVDN
jgi:hypothetical protein